MPTVVNSDISRNTVITDHVVVLTTPGHDNAYMLPRNPFNMDSSYGADRQNVTWTSAAGTVIATGESGKLRRWHASAEPVGDVTVSTPNPPKLVSYRLRDLETASAKYTEAMTIERHKELFGNYSNLYEGVYEDQPDQTLTFPSTDFVIIDDAEAPEEDGLTWSVNVRDGLARHPEFLHLHPGVLIGFRKAIRDEVRSRVGYTGHLFAENGCSEDDGGRLRAWRTVPYEPRRTKFVHDTSRRTGNKLKSGRQVPEAKRLEVWVATPDHIPGRNRADAKRRWNEELEAIASEIVDMLEPAPCWHCKGTGVVPKRSTNSEASHAA